jgi:hypothetical protein
MMTIRYSNTPQLHYGKQPARDADWRTRFPSHAQPITTAPERGPNPIFVFEPNGSGYRAVHYKGQWRKVDVQYDPQDGTTRQVMTGEPVMNPVVWTSS